MPNPATLKTRARRAFNKSAEDYGKNQSPDNYSKLVLAMLALQQARSKFTSGHALAEECLRQMGVHWLTRRNADSLISQHSRDPEAFNIMNAAALAKK